MSFPSVAEPREVSRKPARVEQASGLSGRLRTRTIAWMLAGAFSAAMGGLLSGCSSHAAAPAAVHARGQEQDSQTFGSGAYPTTHVQQHNPMSFIGGNTQDPQRVMPLVVQLSVYQISVPLHAVSDSAEFWRHVDENAIDPTTHDQLDRNGFRAGIAPRADWDYFKNILSQNPVTTRQTGSAGAGEQRVELTVKPREARQLVYYYNRHGDFIGRTFDLSENLIDIDCAPIVRHLGAVRVNICPGIRSLRTELEADVLNNEHEVKVVRHQKFYDVNLSVDIPLDHFLIVAPSSRAAESTRLGHVFLVQDDFANQTEQILVISPQPFIFEPGPTTQPK